MNYEAKYKEALEMARKLNSGEGVAAPPDWSVYEVIFPELRESEDERIRKSILELVKQSSHILNPMNQKSMIAWLEKQGEQKPIMIQWTGDNLKELVHFTGKSPKFEEWFKTWEDFENYIHTHNDIFKLFNEDGSHYEVPVGAWIVKTPDGYNIPSCFKFIQKPAWSEEDNKIAKELIRYLPYCDDISKDTKERWISWLKSLKPQSHWKPTEEQISELGKAAILQNVRFNQSILESLYNDLKSL